MNWVRPLVSIIEIVRNPAQNLTVAVLLLAIVILVVLMAVTALLFYAQSPGPRRGGAGRRRPGQPRSKSR